MPIPYFEQRLSYAADRLLDAEGNAVMMAWEEQIMKQSAEIICKNGGDILNVGFGMGYIDRAIRELKPHSHTIIEGHPDVVRYMVSEGFLNTENTRVLIGRWQDVVGNLKQYDGIYFDTWDEYHDEFHELVPSILKPSGVYSYFNNPGTAHSENTEDFLNLNKLGLQVEFQTLPIQPPQPELQRVDGRHYWDPEVTTYFAPIVRWK